MEFDPIVDVRECKYLFNNGKSTSEVQEYLMKKYNIKRSSTSNFVKYIRKCLGIYKGKYS